MNENTTRLNHVIAEYIAAFWAREFNIYWQGSELGGESLFRSAHLQSHTYTQTYETQIGMINDTSYYIRKAHLLRILG
jgi:hypothetical protein